MMPKCGLMKRKIVMSTVDELDDPGSHVRFDLE